LSLTDKCSIYLVTIHKFSTKMSLIIAFVFGFISKGVECYSFLHQSGTQMQDVNGNRVILKAVGLGGWAIQEGYMLNPAGSSSVGKVYKCNHSIL